MLLQYYNMNTQVFVHMINMYVCTLKELLLHCCAERVVNVDMFKIHTDIQLCKNVLQKSYGTTNEIWKRILVRRVYPHVHMYAHTYLQLLTIK